MMRHPISCLIGMLFTFGTYSAMSQTPAQQGYPGFNNGKVTNEAPNNYPPTAQRVKLSFADGTALTANGFSPGAIVNLDIVPFSASLSTTDSQTLTNQVSSDVNLAWPGPPYATSSVYSQTLSSSPTVDSQTGFTGATTMNVIAVVVVMTTADVQSTCGSGNAGCTSFTVDKTSGFVTSEVTYLDASDQTPEDHEVSGHGLFNLTDTTDTGSVMYYQEGGGPATMTTSDFQTVKTDATNPTPPCNTCPCN